MYEERGGRLHTEPSIGYDPIVCYDHLQESREHLFCSRNSCFASIFRDVVHDRIDTFVTAIKSFIEIAEFLAQTEALENWNLFFFTKARIKHLLRVELYSNKINYFP